MTAFAKDEGNVYKLDMVTSSGNPDSPKATVKKMGGCILEKFPIKGKLERNDSLKNFERVTSETLDHYGRDYIELKNV